jgi:hypothetical protein
MATKYESIINYGLQQKKSKKDIIAALVRENELANAGSYLKQLDDYNAFGDGEPSKPDLSTVSASERQALADIDSTIQMSREAKELLHGVETGPLAGRIQGAKQMLPGGGNREFNKLEAKLSNIKSNFMKALSGAAVSEQEVARLSKFLPSSTDQEEVIKIKLEALENELTTRKKNTFKSVGIETQEGTEELPQEDQRLIADRLNKAYEFAKANPEDEQSKRFMNDWNNNRVDLNTGKLKDEFRKLTPYEQKLKEQTAIKIEKSGIVENNQAKQKESKQFMENVGDFLGGSQIGKAIGEVIGSQTAKLGEAGDVFKNTIAGIEQKFQEGKITEDQRNKMLEGQEKAMRDAFGYNGPNLKQVLGDVVKVGATVLGGAELKGATWLATAARSALVGATYGAASAATEDKKAKDMAVDALIGGAIGGAIPAAGKFIGKGVSKLRSLNTPEEALKQILQGKTTDLTAGQKALAAIKTEGVKTYKELRDRLQESIGYLSGKIDDVLSKDKTVSKLADMATVGKTKGGQEVRTNFVEKALVHLEEMYTKIGDDVSSANIKELMQRAISKGLTKEEVNNIARIYGAEFGNKAFSKTGEALTGVNAQMYETTRKGIKEFVRSGIDGEVAKNIDSLISDQYDTKVLIDKNVEAVNRLQNKLEKMGAGRKLVRGAIKLLDTITAGGTRALRESFIQSNIGKKTMNFLDIEDALKKNLELLNKAGKTNELGKIETALRNFNREFVGKLKNIKAGMTIEDVSKKGKQSFNNPAVGKTAKQSFAGEFQKFERDMSLDKVDSAIQEKSISKFIQQKEKLLEEYTKQNGLVASTDLARNLFEDVGYNGANSKAVHSAASAVKKMAWSNAVDIAENKEAIILSGGSGSAKTSLASEFVESMKRTDTAVLDGNLSSLKSAERDIKIALEAGKTPHIVYVYRDPVDAFMGTIKRALTNLKEKSRIVPVSTVASNHPDSLDVVKTLYSRFQKYAEQGKIKFTLIDNSLGAGKAKKVGIDRIKSITIGSGIKKDMLKRLDAIKKNGLDYNGKKYRLTEEQYNKIKE